MKKYSMETTVGIFIFIGLLCIGYMALKFGNVSLFGSNSYSLFAQFTSVSGLRAGSPVEMFGIEIGQVEKLTVDQEEQMAVVELKIATDIKIYGDAIASIKTAGIIGDKYIHLEPGGLDEYLKPGEKITETQAAIDIEELVSKYAFGNIEK